MHLTKWGEKEKKKRPLHQLYNALSVHEENLSVSFPLQGCCMAV